MAVRAVDAREARATAASSDKAATASFRPLVSGDLDAWIRRRHAARAQLLPELEELDFFHNADSEPPIPLSGDLAPLRALLPGIEAAASSIAGERLVCLQANATLYSAATNAQLGDHKDGSPFSVVVHVPASRPETAGLIFNEELVHFAELRPRGLATRRRVHAPVLRGRRGRGLPCARVFSRFRERSRVRTRGPPASAREVSFHAPDAGAPWAAALRAADSTLVGARGARPRIRKGQGRRLPRISKSATRVSARGPSVERVLGHAVGTRPTMCVCRATLSLLCQVP